MVSCRYRRGGGDEFAVVDLMSGELRDRRGEIPFIDRAETGETAGAVDQDLIPDAAGIH